MSTHKKQTKNTEMPSQTLAPIAIIGMAGILPEAEDINQYWDNIINEVNCIREVPSSRWNIEDYFDPDPSAPDKTYSKYGGFIPDTVFDPMEFGLPPNILEVTDVSQLLSLVVAKKALADAGYAQAEENLLDHTGVILGMVGMASKVIHPLLNRLQYPVWEKVLRSSGIPENEIAAIVEKMKLAYVGWNENAFPGAIGNVIAGRIANRLDLGGTNCIVDAACGSSLAAVSAAVNELALGKADMMISGGVDTDNSILTFMCFSKTPAFSKGNHVRTFSAESDGMLSGEGIGMLVLKRLADAERDNDRIYAVIRGIGTSSDGHYKSIYAPRASGQAKALRRAYQNAGYPQTSVGLIEAHGTGTMAGDPAEFEGLREAFSEDNAGRQHIALGSVKSQIGHTKATAGAASLIKASLALHHKVLPATINVSKPQPAMDIENTSFYLNTETRPWFKNDPSIPRRAGVSSFGFGGTNFHIALEEYSHLPKGAFRRQQVPYTVLLSAPTPDALQANANETLSKLESANGAALLNQLDQQAANANIPANHARLGFVALSLEDACGKLRDCSKLFISNKDQAAWSHPKGIYYRKSALDPKGKTVALFPGQGSQYLNMGRELAINFPPVREAFEKANTIIADKKRAALTSIVYPIPVFSDEDRESQVQLLTQTENAQPAIGTLSLALHQLLSDAGFKADFFAGHSFGELTALWAAGVYSEEAFLRLAKARGEAMSTPAASGQDTGTMIAVKGDVEKIQALLKGQKEVTIANFNSTSQVVLAGGTDAVRAIQAKLEDQGLKVYPLQVSAAFHTAFVKHAQKPFKQAIDKEEFKSLSGKVFSNSSAQAHDEDPQKIRQLLADHILNAVRFKEEIEAIYAAGGSIFIEIGPKNVLTNLVKDILKDNPYETITLNASPKASSDTQLRQAVLQMRVLGFELGNVDPFRKYPEFAQTKVSPVAVSLNGGLYTSEKTRAAFEKALAEKPQRAVPPAPAPAVALQQPQKLTPSPLPLERPNVNGNPTQAQSLIERFQDHQRDFMKTHEQYLQNDSTAKKILQDITQSELNLISQMGNNPLQPKTDETLALMAKQAELVNNQQTATSEAHQTYIQSQTTFSQQYASLITALIGTPAQSGFQPVTQPARMPAAQPAMAPAPTPAAQTPVVESQAIPAAQPVPARAYSAAQLQDAFLVIVSDKTGYPTDMLELGMDMEADLGIDSIKRVEILGAMQEQFPELPALSPEDLAVMRTLEQIIGAFTSASSATAAPQSAMPMAAATIQNSTTTAYAEADLQDAFLQIVSDKTGYPTDMLELGMDMEADLGIDSIKRVEILGAMQEQFPELPSIEAEELSTIRTLEQIIVSFNKASQSSTTSAQTSPVTAPQTKTSSQSSPASASVTYASADLQTAFLAIVSDKTGYPTDMLELGMDMEADLGIDSIKRVEILGAMQEQFPALTAIEAEELTTLRSLEDIISAFNKAPQPSAQPDLAVQASVPETQSANVSAATEKTYAQSDLQNAFLAIVSDKTGYPADMLELGMDMEADLGIDSIKRVEILGAMQEQFPALPAIEAEELTTLRTLEGIINAFDNSAKPIDTSVQPNPVPASLKEEIQENKAKIERFPVAVKPLPQPDYLEFELPKDSLVLITDDGTDRSRLLAKSIQQQGQKVGMVHFNGTAVKSDLPEDVLNIHFESADEVEIQTKMEALITDHAKIAAFIHMDPPANRKGKKLLAVSENKNEVLKSVFLMARHLKKPLTAAGETCRPAFLTVTQMDGHFGLNGNNANDPLPGGFAGLAKTLRLEWKDIFCRALDLHPDIDAQRAVDCIQNELHDPDLHLAEVGYTPEGRFTLVLQENES